MPARISIIIPTITGRSDYLQNTVAAYHACTVNEFELIIVRDHPYVASGWNKGVQEAAGDFFFFTNDDIEPMQDWDVPAVETCERGEIPVPGSLINLDRKYGDRHLEDGQAVSGYGGDITVLPFCSRAQWEQIGAFIDVHYFSDSWFSHRCAKLGLKMVGRKGFEFIHHLAQPGRGAGMTEDQRMVHDAAIYHAAVQRDSQ